MISHCQAKAGDRSCYLFRPHRSISRPGREYRTLSRRPQDRPGRASRHKTNRQDRCECLGGRARSGFCPTNFSLSISCAGAPLVAGSADVSSALSAQREQAFKSHLYSKVRTRASYARCADGTSALPAKRRLNILKRRGPQQAVRQLISAQRREAQTQLRRETDSKPPASLSDPKTLPLKPVPKDPAANCRPCSFPSG
jgi:hypothetical protein